MGVNGYDFVFFNQALVEFLIKIIIWLVSDEEGDGDEKC